MFGAFRAVRSDERRDTWAAFFTLFGLISSHQVLETARDALFLSKIDASNLPWVYLIIAAVSLFISRLRPRNSRLSSRAKLGLTILAASGVTGLLFVLTPFLGDYGLYAIYVWSGVLTTIVLLRFWTLLGSVFTVTQAKRLYSVIGTGSVLGAIAGSVVATAMTRVVEAEYLLLITAAGLVVAAAASMLLNPPADVGSGAAKGKESDGGILDAAEYVARQTYARHVGLLVIASAACLTFADYAFKSTIAAEIPAEELPEFFASLYLVLNVLSFVAQLGLVGWILRRFDLSIALVVLPVLLLLSGVGLVASVILASSVVFTPKHAAVFLKGADGSLRYSLHRTASELLFVPLSERSRARVKAFIDVAGQKGGQALASLGILGLVALGAGSATMAVVLAILAGVWVALALGIRRPYLDLFRGRLNEGRIRHLEEFPDLDVGSLETLVAALDSENDDEVLAALELLEREGRERVVPGLILYHPSSAVVEFALRLFTRTRRRNVGHIAGRLLQHKSARIRAAALTARSVLQPDEELLRSTMRADDSEEVRAAATIQLAAIELASGGEVPRSLRRLIDEGETPSCVAIAEAVALGQSRGFEEVLIELSAHPAPEVRVAAFVAMGVVPDPVFNDALLQGLAEEDTRATARDVLWRQGDEVLPFLEEALEDTELPRVVRWQLPRTIARFEPAEASRMLLARLPREPDGLVRYRSIRSLEALLKRDPTLELNRDHLARSIRRTTERAYRYLDMRISLTKGGGEDEKRRTPGHELLVRLVRDKETHAVGRAFRLIGLAHRNEDFGRIHRGLSSKDRLVRATSLELIENVLRQPLRGAILGLVDDMPDDQRMALGSPYHPPRLIDYDVLLGELIDGSSVTLRQLAIYHVGELRLRRFEKRISDLAESTHDNTDAIRTLEILAAGEKPDGQEAHDAG